MRVIAYSYQENSSDAPLSVEAGEYTLDHHYQDRAIVSSPDYRPQLQQLLDDNQSNPADLLLVSSLDALGDNLTAVSQVISNLETQGTQVTTLSSRSAAAGQGATASDSSRVTLLRLAADIQVRQRRRQLRAGHARNRLQALPPPGKAPYGYRRGQDRYILDRTAAPVVTAFVEEFLLYGSLRGAVRFVERRFGKGISVSTGRRWLTHPVYRGDLQYGDGQVMRGTHAAIISRDAAAQIDRLLRRNSQLPPRTAGASQSLAGLVSCSACQTPMAISKTTVRRRNQGYVYLRPTQCPRQPRCRAIPYDVALHRIITQICQDLPQAVSELQAGTEPGPDQGPSSAGVLQPQIDQKEAAMAQLPDLVKTGILDPESADLRRYTLRGEISRLQDQIAQLPPVNLQELSQAVAIPQFWLDLSESERRFFFREFIRDIRIAPQTDGRGIELVFVF